MISGQDQLKQILLARKCIIKFLATPIGYSVTAVDNIHVAKISDTLVLCMYKLHA